MSAPKKILSLLSAFDRSEGLVKTGDRVLIAVSGGPDSVCLAHYLHRLSQKRHLKLRLIHMHHGLRGKQADQDAAFVQNLAQKLNLPLSLVRIPVAHLAKLQKRSLEDAGRKLRYRALAAFARKLGFDKVATGHQLDDQAETVLLHLMRGTKARGLAGIPAKRLLRAGRNPSPRNNSVQVIRPLLALNRGQILSYLKAYGLPYRSDRSNRSLRFTRNWLRHKVLPLLARKNPRIREHLAAIANDVRSLLEIGTKKGVARYTKAPNRCR